MLNLIEKIFKKPACVEYLLPQGFRVYAVGDIHGRADLLKDIHRLIEEDAARDQVQENVLVYLGDYIDRGVFVREALDMLCSDVLPGFRRIFLKGNHEQMMLEFLENPELLEPWVQLGGQSTLLSYGVKVSLSDFSRNKAESAQKALIDSLPREHFSFLSNLKLCFELGDYLFVHAGVRPGKALSEQIPEDLLWIRDDFLSSGEHFGARIVHGHSIVSSPEILPNRINVDTGAYASGKLNCAVLEKDRVRVLSQ